MTTGLTNLGVDFTDVSATPRFTDGAQTLQDSVEYSYVRAGAAIAAGDVLVVDVTAANEPNTLVPASALNQPVAALALNAIPNGFYGWVVTRGRCPNVKVAASTAANAQLGTTATAGTASTITVSATPTQAEIQRVLAAASGRGLIALDAEASGRAEVEIR